MGKHIGILNAGATRQIQYYTGGGYATQKAGRVFYTPMTKITTSSLSNGAVRSVTTSVNKSLLHSIGCKLCLHVYVGGKTYDYPAATTSSSYFYDNDNGMTNSVAGAFKIRANNKTGYLFGSVSVHYISSTNSDLSIPSSIMTITNRSFLVIPNVHIFTQAVTRFSRLYYESTVTSQYAATSWGATGTTSTTYVQIASGNTTSYYTNSALGFSNTIVKNTRNVGGEKTSSRSTIFQSGYQTYQTTVVTCNVTSQEAGWTHSQGNFAWSSSSNTAWLTARRSGRDARITTSMKRTFTHSFYSNQNNIYSNHNSYISGSGSVNIKQFTTSHTKGSYSSKQYDTPAVNASSATTASKAVNASSSTYGSTQTNTRYVSYSLKTKSINSGYASSSNNRTTETIWSSRQTTWSSAASGSHVTTLHYGNIVTCKYFFSYASYPVSSKYTASIWYHNFVT